MTLSTRSSISRTTLISMLCLLVLFSLLVFNTSCFSSRRPDLAWLDYDHDAASLIEATRVPKIISPEATDLPSNVHTFRDDGELTVGTDARRHPVLEILEHASSKWESLLHAHGGDQTHAFMQYRAQRFEKTPAVSRASSRNPQLDLFTPISASLLAPRQREAEILPDTFTLIVRSGVPSIIYGNLTISVSEKYRARRAELLLHAIRPFINDLPDLRATFNVLPQPRHALSSHSVEVLAALSADRTLPNSPVKLLSQVEPTGMNTAQGRPIHADDLKQLERTMKVQKHWSWENACHAQVDAPGEDDTRDDLTPPIRFVALPEARSDLCLHRALPNLHPVYESIYTTYHTRLSPIISETTATWASDVLLPPLDFFAPEFRKGVASTMPWSNRTSGLFWRGAPTEVSYASTHLQRLVAFARNTEEHDIILPADNEGFLIDRKRLADIVNFNIQQGSEDPEAEAGWKFLIELGDGAQMQTKMASGALVFRPLLLSDWVSEHSVPWVHYIPVQPDLSDLPSLMAFFQRHDALARRVADAGQAWAREQLSHTRAQESVKEVLEGWARLGSAVPGHLREYPGAS